MKKDKGFGQYDLEYKECPCFWGESPAKYVQKFTDMNLLNKGKVLDLGAGEGKNSFFLHHKGFDVTAIEVSKYAVRNFIDRVIKEELENSPTIILSDIRNYKFDNFKWNLVVCYGVLHCLESIEQANNILDKIMNSTKVGGYNILSSFTNLLGVPDVQDYLTPLLLDEKYIQNYYTKNQWEIISYENDIITETHPTSNIPHQHSLYRIIAKKNIA